MKKIVIASDSFKGSLSSADVSKAAAEGIYDVYPLCEAVCLPMGDGGEGTCEALAEVLSCEWIEAETIDPLGRPVTARYAIADNTVPTAIIELAQASGLTLLKNDERNPLRTSTFGTGILILDAIRRGCRRFIIGLGGSATNDGGTGMLEALGFRFLDHKGEPITGCCGAKLKQISTIDSFSVDEEVLSCTFTIICDVDTPFCGNDGATRIFAPQKGADASSIEILEEGMTSLAEVIRTQYGIDLKAVAGSGAAGGAAGGLYSSINASIRKGSDFILEAVGFEEMIKDADLIITGEGKIDRQTFYGKLPSTVLNRASGKGIPVIAIGGIVDLSETEIKDSGFLSIVPIQAPPADFEALTKAMDPSATAANIRHCISTFLQNGISRKLTGG